MIYQRCIGWNKKSSLGCTSQMSAFSNSCTLCSRILPLFMREQWCRNHSHWNMLCNFIQFKAFKMLKSSKSATESVTVAINKNDERFRVIRSHLVNHRAIHRVISFKTDHFWFNLVWFLKNCIFACFTPYDLVKSMDNIGLNLWDIFLQCNN